MDVTLKKYIEAKMPEFKKLVFPCFTTVIDKMSITYTITPIESGYIKKYDVEIKIYGTNYDEVRKSKYKLIEILESTDQKEAINFNNNYFTAKLSGGGILFRDDLQIWEDSSIFIIKGK